MSGLMGGSWKRSSPIGHPRVPSRCAEKPQKGSIGTQPTAQLPPRQLPTRLRYGASKRTFSYLNHWVWWRLILWIRRKHPRLTWKQMRRRYYGADRITEDSVTLYNPARMRVERYRYRGAQISTPYNIDEVDPAGARFRQTRHDDVAFVGKVSELITTTPP